MDKVKQMVAAGVSVPTAIREALRMTDAAFADKYNLGRSAVSNQITGRVRPTDGFLAALMTELGGSEADWREMIWRGAKPEHVELHKAV